jgi:DHA2 family multidrug resistance protein
LRIGTVLSFILGFGLYGSTFIIPIYTQSILGWTALQAGALMIPSAVATAVMMPFIGKLIAKGVKQQYLVSLGFFIFFIYSFWGYKLLTPDTGEANFFWMLIVRGLGLSLLFIPITTLSLSTLKGKEIGQGASFTGMMRQLGGSFGIALITTFITNSSAKYVANLANHLDANDWEVQQRISQLKTGFMIKGMTPDVALQSAYKSLQYSIQKQAAVLSYMDVFLYLGILFLICIPIMLFTKQRKSKEKIDISSAMH